MKKYYHIEDGDTIELNKRGETIKFGCCDCGLIHKFSIAIQKNGRVGVMIRRDNRATAQLRRYNKFAKESK